MMEGKIRLGYAMCGSFCTLEHSVRVLTLLAAKGYDLYPIMSPITYSTDTRFGRAEDFRWAVEDACGRKIMTTVVETEPIGPKKLLDALLILPCTGNTLAKLAHGVADSSVTLAAKAHLRNERPVIVAVSTNDGLGANAASIGRLMARKNIYFLPFRQDDALGKPCSLVADFQKAPEAVAAALAGRQLQPLLL